MTDTINEMTMIGRAYLNGANYLKYVAKMNAVNEKAVEAHNKKLRQAARADTRVAEIEAELERLQRLLAEKVR